MRAGTDHRTAAHRLPPGWQFTLSAVVLFLALFGSHLATPLYPIWQADFGLSNTDIAIIFAGYPVGVTFGLLHGGRLGDQLGRKPLTRAGLLTILAASLCYLWAGGFTSLLVARLLNGYGIGLLSGPAVAAIVELHPTRNRGSASRIGAIATLSAPAAGMLTATLIAHYATGPTAVAAPYIIFAVLLSLGLILTGGYRETIHPEEKRSLRSASFRPQALRVPPGIALPFAYAACVAVLTWANTGLWLSLGPSIIPALMQGAHPMTGGLAVVAFLTTAGIVQLGGGWLGYLRAIVVSLILVIAALTTVLASLHAGGVAGVALGMLLGGTSQGLAWMGAVELTNRIAPDWSRATVLSVLYICCYFGSVVPVLLTGLAADVFGLSLAFGGLCVLSMSSAVALLIWTARLRGVLPDRHEILPDVPKGVDRTAPAAPPD